MLLPQPAHFTSSTFGFKNNRKIIRPKIHVKNVSIPQPTGFMPRFDALIPTAIAKPSEIVNNIAMQTNKAVVWPLLCDTIIKTSPNIINFVGVRIFYHDS